MAGITHAHGYTCTCAYVSLAFLAGQVCVTRMAGSYASRTWLLCVTRMAAFCRVAARGSASAGARTLDRPDRGDDDDDDGTMIDMGVVVGVGVGGGGSEILDQVDDDDDDDDGLPRTKKSGAPKRPAPWTVRR